jgi:NitT/TauT family transport system substrate-binding protein
MKTLSDKSRGGFSRRSFLANTSALGVASFLGLPRTAVAEPPPETTRLKLMVFPQICLAPQYLAETLLKAEGFTEIQYVEADATSAEPSVGPGKADLDMNTVAPLLTYLDAGAPVVTLAGVHLGCYELFGTERVRSIRDLKGKTVPVNGLGGSKHVLLSSMVAYVGLDPRKDINWIDRSPAEAMKLLADGKADAFLGFPPEPQELRARKIGRVIVNTATDKPWSQYYCCMLISYREFVQKHPVATKRAARAILKAADLCAQQPESAARAMVDKGFAQDYNYALETLKEVRYDAWRSYNPEDTMLFHALRLHEVGMIKTSPSKLIAQGTDWRFLNELKKELKA